MSTFETEEDRARRYSWTEDDNVELKERGTGEKFDIAKMLSELENDGVDTGGLGMPEDDEKSEAKAEDSDGPASVHRVVHGLDVIVETAKGYVRGGWDEERQRSWEQVMPYDYGYIQGVEGADGDSLDVMLGPNQRSAWVYVIDQRHLPPQKGFDEHKVLMGYDSQAQALSAYRRGHHRSKDVLMDWTPMHVNDFKQWLRTHDMSKPCSTEV